MIVIKKLLSFTLLFVGLLQYDAMAASTVRKLGGVSSKIVNALGNESAQKITPTKSTTNNVAIKSLSGGTSSKVSSGAISERLPTMKLPSINSIKVVKPVATPDNTTSTKADLSALSNQILALEEIIHNAIDGGATKTELDEISERINALNDALDSATNDLDVATGRIDAIDEQMETVASNEDLATVSGKVSALETTMAGVATVDALNNINAQIETLNTNIATKASNEDLATVSGKVSVLETTVTDKASSADLNTLSGRVDALQTTVNAGVSSTDWNTIRQEINTAVAGAGITAVTDRVSTLESAVNNEETGLNAVNEKFDSLESAVVEVVGEAPTDDTRTVFERLDAIDEQMTDKANTSDLSNVQSNIEAVSTIVNALNTDAIKTVSESGDGSYVSNVSKDGNTLTITKTNVLVAPVQNEAGELQDITAEIWIVK